MSMITPEVLTAAGGVVTATLTAWNARQGKRLKELEGKTTHLEQWRNVAVTYIGTLRFLLSQHGIPTPPPPAELGLHLTDEPHKE